jgi:hypothetical protein
MTFLRPRWGEIQIFSRRKKSVLNRPFFYLNCNSKELYILRNCKKSVLHVFSVILLAYQKWQHLDFVCLVDETVPDFPCHVKILLTAWLLPPPAVVLLAENHAPNPFMTPARFHDPRSVIARRQIDRNYCQSLCGFGNENRRGEYIGQSPYF